MLELKNVSYYYKSQKDTKVLKGVNYRFEKGKMYAVLGASGSGKTTLLSLLAGLDEPVSGEIYVGRENIQAKGLVYHRKNNISLVFQNYNLIDYLTPVENVLLGGKVDAKVLLAQMGIGAAPVKEMSCNFPADNNRELLLQGLASKAPILLADEPTGNLDETTASEITEIFKKLAHEREKCVIVVTHSKKLAEEADVIVRLKDGKIS